MNLILNITAFSPPFLHYLHIDPEEWLIVGKLQEVSGMDKRIKKSNMLVEEVEHIIRNLFASSEAIMDEFPLLIILNGFTIKKPIIRKIDCIISKQWSISLTSQNLSEQENELLARIRQEFMIFCLKHCASIEKVGK